MDEDQFPDLEKVTNLTQLGGLARANTIELNSLRRRMEEHPAEEGSPGERLDRQRLSLLRNRARNLRDRRDSLSRGGQKPGAGNQAEDDEERQLRPQEKLVAQARLLEEQLVVLAREALALRQQAMRDGDSRVASETLRLERSFSAAAEIIRRDAR